MSTDSLSELLPLPPGVVRPTAFDVLGIEPTEDATKIEHAIRAVLTRLKIKQPTADPETFERAVGLVRKAKKILEDPQRRKRLVEEADAKRSEANESSAPEDPLAGILPPVDPLAGILPAVEDLDSNPAADTGAPRPPSGGDGTGPPDPRVGGVAPVQESETDGAPVATPAVAVPEAAAAPPTPVAAPAPIVRKTPRRRRRGPSLMSCAMVLAVFGLLAIVGGLAFVLVLKPDGFAVTRGSDGLTVGMSPPADRPAVSPPAASRRGEDAGAGSNDPIMRPPPPSSGAPSGLDDMSPMNAPDVSGGMDRDDAAMDASSDDVAEPSMEMGTTAMPPDPMTTDERPRRDSANLASELEIAAATESIEKLRQAIRSKQWDAMKPLAESVREQPMTPEQSETIEALYALADLASYYRGGIRRGLADQEATRDFEVVPDFRVIIVEVNDDSIAVQFNRQIKRFALDELPTVIADRLASFAIPQSGTRAAAAATYHVLTAEEPDTIQSELNYLRSLDESINEIPTAELADELATIVGQSGSP